MPALREVRLLRTRRPIWERARLALDPHLGAGTFFWRSYRRSRVRDVPLFFTDDDRSYTVEQLAMHVKRAMDFYTDHGIGTDTHVGLQVADGVTGFVNHVALTSLGAVAVHCNPRMDPDRAIGYFARSDASVVFADAALHGPDTPSLRWHEAPPLVDGHYDLGEIPDPRFEADKLIMISHSSGTTGTPKTPQFTHGGFFAGKRLRLFTFAQSRDDRLMTSLPHSHSAGLSYMTTALLTATPIYVFNPTSARSIEDAISDFSPTGVLSFPSTFANLDVDRIDPAALDGVRFWNGMGDASHTGHIRRLLAAAPRSTYIDGLGSSEMGMVLFSTVKGPDAPPTRNIGHSVPVVEDVAVFDDDGNKLPAGTAGRLGVKTPSSTPGYYGDESLTSASLCGDYFMTGDIVQYVAVDDTWRHLDRVSDVIATTEGPRYSTLAEEIVHDVVDACDCAVIGLPDGDGDLHPVAFVALRAGVAAPSAASIHDAIRARIDGLREPLAARPVGVVVFDDVARISHGVTGKVVKHAMRSTYATCLVDRTARGASADVVDEFFA